MTPIAVKSCGEQCEFYDFSKGICVLYYSVDPDLRKSYRARVDIGEECRFGISSDKTVSLTPQGILAVLLDAKYPLEFYQTPTLANINPEALQHQAQS